MQGNSVTGFIYFTNLFNPFVFLTKAVNFEYLIFLCDKYVAVCSGGVRELFGIGIFVYLYVLLYSYVCYECSLMQKSVFQKTKRATKNEDDEV